VAAGVVEDAMVLIGIGFTGVVVVFVEAGGSDFLVPNGVLGFTGVETEAVFTGVFFAPSATLTTLD
jgi:hypothetical protein